MERRHHNTVQRTLLAGALAVIAAGGCGSGGGGAYTGDAYHYVVQRVGLPETAGHAQSLVRDIDGDGTKENELGHFFAAINTMAISHGCQQTVNSAFKQGKSLLLLQVQLSQEPLDSKIKLVQRMGQDLDGDPSNNFSGKAKLQPSPKGQQAALDGTLTAGALLAGRGPAILPLAPGGEARVVALGRGQLEGQATPDGLASGALSGGVPWDQFKLLLLPQLATVINCVVQNPIGGAG